MALNDVRFVTSAGGLGRLPAEKDYVSAIIMSLADTPSNWPTALGKKYLSLREAEGDGITDGDADFGLLWYFIREYFRVAGASELYVIDASDALFTAQNVFDLTGGELRQAAWYTTTNYAGIVAQIGTIKTFGDALTTLHAPCVFVTNVKDESTAINGSGQPDLRTAAAPTVSVLISGDHTGKGASIADDDLSVNYVPALGTVLGLMARAKVHENIGWVAQFNMAEGSELQDTRFSSGVAYNTIAAAVLDTLNTKGYVFLRRHVGVAGTYVNDTHTADAATSDYAYIENNRTVQKARRVLRAALIPQLLSPLTVDEDGKLSPDTVKFFENLAQRPLERMVSAGELSNQNVYIDPDQDVLTTSTLSIEVELQPRGVARTIQVTIGLAVSV